MSRSMLVTKLFWQTEEVWILCFPIFTNSIAIIESSSRHCRLWCMAILVRILLARKTHAITISISQTNVILFALYYCVFNKADVELVTLYLWSNRESLSRNLIIKGLLICKIVSHVSGSYPSMREIIQPGIIRLLYQSSPLYYCTKIVSIWRKLNCISCLIFSPCHEVLSAA